MCWLVHILVGIALDDFFVKKMMVDKQQIAVVIELVLVAVVDIAEIEMVLVVVVVVVVEVLVENSLIVVVNNS